MKESKSSGVYGQIRGLYKDLKNFGDEHPILPFITSAVLNTGLFLFTEPFVTQYVSPLLYHTAPAILIFASRTGEQIARYKLFKTMQKVRSFKVSEYHSPKAKANQIINSVPGYIRRLVPETASDKGYLLRRYLEITPQILFPPFAIVNSVMTLRKAAKNFTDLKALNSQIKEKFPRGNSLPS